MNVALLSGGTGGAKLARGLVDVVGGENLTVIANTGDDTWVHGAHVSPDPDLVTYWLADAIDKRGYGIRGDSWQVVEALEAAGRPTWFQLGDRDLAMCLIRSELLRDGATLTEAHAAVVAAMGVAARVLPMCDEPAPTAIAARGRVVPFQEFMIVERAAGPLEGVGLLGAPPGSIGATASGLGAGPAARAGETAPEPPAAAAPRPTAAVLAALADADAIVIGPSNPIASIAPILALPGLQAALAAAPAPVVAVSPFVGGAVLKGPTELFCEFAGIDPSAAGIAAFYAEVADAIVADEPVPAPGLETSTLLDTPDARRRVADEVVSLATRLRAN